MKKGVRPRLISARKSLGWSQQELASQLGTTQHNVSRWESGRTTPGPYFRARLCELFQCSPQQLDVFLGETVGEDQQTAGEKSSSETSSLDQLSHVPAPWNVPYPRNPFFTGREDLLSILHDALQNRGCLALSQSWAISGLGGIGKTQIALEYAYHYRQEYQAVFWVSAASHETFLTGFVSIAHLLQLPERQEADKRRVFEAVQRWMSTHHNWLLILDNADSEEVLKDFSLPEQQGHLLLTTRLQALGSLAQRIEIPTMGMAEGTFFLLRRSGLIGPDRLLEETPERLLSCAEAIAVEMDFLPLALDQAGAYIDETGCGLETYLELYRAHRLRLLQRRGETASHHPDSVAITWALSFELVKQMSPLASDLLRLFAFLEADNIPEEIFLAESPSFALLPAKLACDVLQFNDALRALRKFSLIRRDHEKKLLHIHRLVQAVLKDSMDEEEQRSWAELAVRITSSLFPHGPAESNEPRFQRYLPLAQTCSGLIQDYAIFSEAAVSLLLRTAAYLYSYALYEQAEPLYQMIVRIREQTREPAHPDLAAALLGMARICKVLKQFEQAETFCRRALCLYETAPVRDELAVTDSLIELGRIYLAQGRYEQAEQPYRQALSLREQFLDAHHAGLARALTELGRLFFWQGKYTEAEPLCQRAFALLEQTDEVDHADLASVLNLLGCLAERRQSYAEATRYYQRALSMRETQYGPRHYSLAGPLHNLAELYTLQAKYAEAEPLHRRAIAIWRETLGAGHPNVGYGLYGLADFYFVQGNYEQAEQFYRQALEIWQQAWAPDHPDISFGLHGLANVQSKLGNDLAESLYQQALTLQEKALGVQHPETIKTRNDYAAFRESRLKRSPQG